MNTLGSPPLNEPDSRPERMYRQGRPVDPAFEPEEGLYYRIRVPGSRGEKPEGVDIRLPEDSVNRAKYSEPEDVLYPNYFALGIATFKVGAIPRSRHFTDDSGITREYGLRVEHDPCEENYAHSEVRAFRAGERVSTSKKLPLVVKSEFRQLIAEAMTILRPMQETDS